MTGSGKGTAAAFPWETRSGLVIAEVALSIMLLTVPA